MTEKRMTSVNTVHEAEYLSDYYTGEALKYEQQSFIGYRAPIDGGHMFTGAGHEGSWLNNPRNRKE